MRLSIQFRDTKTSAWKRCRSAWTFDDIAYLNRVCGYEKYRVVRVTS